ncbi:MAG: hypothetical protein ACYC3W_09850 [Candidatus Nanopelagicales bacterium]
MREVKMKTLDAGPNGVRYPGKTYLVPKAEAKALVSGNHAEFTNVHPPEKAVSAPSPAKAVVVPPEKADLPPSPGEDAAKGKK